MGNAVKVPMILMIIFAWALVGLIVALSQDYGEINSGSDAWTFGLAILLWPVVLAGGDVRIQF